jgi:hypothetical protein
MPTHGGKPGGNHGLPDCDALARQRYWSVVKSAGLVDAREHRDDLPTQTGESAATNQMFPANDRRA